MSRAAREGGEEGMRFHELATLELETGVTRLRLGEALDSISGYLMRRPEAGRLLGCWLPDFGEQNRIVVLRGFQSQEHLDGERDRILHDGAPFLPADMLRGIRLESFGLFPTLPPIEPGSFGRVYEFRTYVLKIGGLAPTIEAWSKGIGARTALSPLIGALHALDGRPRFLHIWAYRDHAERERVRAEAFRTGAWPAKGAPEWLTRDLRSETMIPTAISPLR